MSKNKLTSANLVGTIKLIKADAQKRLLTIQTVKPNVNVKVLNSQIEVNICNKYLSVMIENSDFRFDYELSQSNGAYFYSMTCVYDLNE